VHVNLTQFLSGEPIVEPEVDLAAFLEKQRISDGIGPTAQLLEKKEEDQDDITAFLNSLKSRTLPPSKKGNVQQIEWSEELEELNREKKAAEAAKGQFNIPVVDSNYSYLSLSLDLKERFKAKSEKLRTKPITTSSSLRVKPGRPQLISNSL